MDGSHVHHMIDQQVGAQLCPCGLANGYAAVLHRGLPPDNPSHLGSSPGPDDPYPGAHRAPAHIRQVGAGFYV